MDKSNIQSIAEAWSKMHSFEINSTEYEEHFWAFEKIDELIHSNPLEALDVILKIIEINPTERILSNLGAGHIEDLMCYKGEEVINKIKKEAKRNANFKKSLASTWLDSNDSPFMKEFYEIAEVEPPFED